MSRVNIIISVCALFSLVTCDDVTLNVKEEFVRNEILKISCSACGDNVAIEMFITEPGGNTTYVDDGISHYFERDKKSCRMREFSQKMNFSSETLDVCCYEPVLGMVCKTTRVEPTTTAAPWLLPVVIVSVLLLLILIGLSIYCYVKRPHVVVQQSRTPYAQPPVEAHQSINEQVYYTKETEKATISNGVHRSSTCQ